MAMSIPKGTGFASMLKDGARYFSGVEEAVIRNIEACVEFSKTLRTAYGPRGLNKMIINHIEKLFVTSDAATIIRELEVQHPAAKMMVMASHMQEQEVGDGTNFVILLIGALLEKAEELVRMGLKPAEITEGYEMALDKILDEFLPQIVFDEIKDIRNAARVEEVIRSSIMSKQYGNQDFLAPLITKACLAVMPESEKTNVAFNVDNVRVVKILGCGIQQSSLVMGMVFKRQVEGDITKMTAAKVAAYTCPVDVATPETKGTVLIKSAQELLDFNRGEETQLEAQIKAIADSGVTVVVSGGKYGDLALHYMNKYKLMAVRLQSKFDLRRLCKTVGATALTKLLPPKADEMGHCDNIYMDEVGETEVVIFRQDDSKSHSKIVTIVIRGSTDNLMDDIERAVDDGINTFKGLTKDGRIVAGAGAAETELARLVSTYGEQQPGIEQYAIIKLAEAIQSLPIAIAENAGLKPNEMLSTLQAAHQEGQKFAGVNVEADKASVQDSVASKIFDLHAAKYWGIKYAINTAVQILLVDQIICAKPAGGGPKPRENKNWDED